jgi:hypothetical protein
MGTFMLELCAVMADKTQITALGHQSFFELGELCVRLGVAG